MVAYFASISLIFSGMFTVLPKHSHIFGFIIYNKQIQVDGLICAIIIIQLNKKVGRYRCHFFICWQLGCGRGALLTWGCTLSPSKEVWVKVHKRGPHDWKLYQSIPNPLKSRGVDSKCSEVFWKCTPLTDHGEDSLMHLYHKVKVKQTVGPSGAEVFL